MNTVSPRCFGTSGLVRARHRAQSDHHAPVAGHLPRAVGTPVPVGRTIADGQQLAAPGQHTFAVIQALAEDVVGVQDAQIVDAMRYLFERQKLVVEPSGASALAAILSGSIDVRGLRVGVILSGGNIAVDRFLHLMEQPS